MSIFANAFNLFAKSKKGITTPVNSNAFGNLLVSLDEQKDAFGRLKVAEPYTIFDNSLTSSFADTFFWAQKLNGTAQGTYDRNTSSFLMETLIDDDYYLRQLKFRIKYQPAKSHEFFISVLMSTESGQRKRAGLVDYDNIGLVSVSNVPQNGVFFENNAGILSWNIANNGTITEKVIQSNWNVDKVDGTGRSGFNFNPNTVNILICQLEWLASGIVLVGFVSDSGDNIYVHAFMHASTEGFVNAYMRTANLPLAFEITSISGAGSMKQICSAVISGGGFNPTGDSNAVWNDDAVSVASGNIELLVGLRLKADHFEFTIDPTNITILSTANGDSQWFLCINPTYSGTVSFADKANTVVQQAVNNGNDVTNYGKIIDMGFFSNDINSVNKEIKSTLKIGKDLNGNLDELWLVVKAFGNETYRGGINFKQSI